MRLIELYEPTLVNEIFDTKVSVTNWKQNDNESIGSITIDDEKYQITLERLEYTLNNKIPFLNVSFQAFDKDGNPIEELTSNNKVSPFKVIGAITNAILDAVNKTKYQIIVFIAQDNIESRMGIYNRIANSNLTRPFTAWRNNIPLGNGAKATIMFNGKLSPDTINQFEKHLKMKGK